VRAFADEQLIGQAIAGRRDEVVLATKFTDQKVEGSNPFGRSRSASRPLLRSSQPRLQGRPRGVPASESGAVGTDVLEEHESAPRFEYPVNLRESARRIVDRAQHERGDNEIEARIPEGKVLSGCTHHARGQ
jgi:hypothetical protein